MSYMIHTCGEASIRVNVYLGKLCLFILGGERDVLPFGLLVSKPRL